MIDGYNTKDMKAKLKKKFYRYIERNNTGALN